MLAMFHRAAVLRTPSVRDQYEKEFKKLPEHMEWARRSQSSAESPKEEEPPKQMNLF